MQLRLQIFERYKPFFFSYYELVTRVSLLWTRYLMSWHYIYILCLQCILWQEIFLATEFHRNSLFLLSFDAISNDQFKDSNNNYALMCFLRLPRPNFSGLAMTFYLSWLLYILCLQCILWQEIYLATELHRNTPWQQIINRHAGLLFNLKTVLSFMNSINSRNH